MKIFLLLAMLCLFSCSEDNNYSSPNDWRPNEVTPAPTPLPGGWSEKERDQEVAACVRSALGGQTNHPALEADAQKYCGCVYDVLIKEGYTYSSYSSYGGSLVSILESKGKLSHCGH